MKHDAEKLLLWLIGNALFNAFLLLDVLRGKLIFGNVTASVLILMWTSVLVLYLEFLKEGNVAGQKLLQIESDGEQKLNQKSVDV